MSEIAKTNLGFFLDRLFSKSIIDYDNLNFKDYDGYENVLSEFKYDYQRYFNEPVMCYDKLNSRIELIGILLYRLARYYYLNNDEICAVKYGNLGRLISGFEIYYSAEIGRGLKINHGLGTVIGARSVLGQNILIHQNVTLGDKNGNRPIINDNVIIYAGAKILGDLTVGTNAIIGANTLCMKDVPENAKAVGNPMRLI